MADEAERDEEKLDDREAGITALPLFIPARFRDELLRTLSGSELLVFLVYASRANRDGIAWPTLDGLCRDTGLSMNTVKVAKKSLVKRGLLEKVRQESGQLGMYGNAIVKVRTRF